MRVRGSTEPPDERRVRCSRPEPPGRSPTHTVMNKLSVALLGALAVVAVPALSGCETETGTDLEGDGTANVDTAVVVEDDSVGMDTDMNINGDSVEAGADEAGAEAGEALDSAGAAIGRAGNAVGDVIDENVDVGENADNQ